MRIALFLMLLVVIWAVPACRSSASSRGNLTRDTSQSADPVNPLSADQPHQMAADDADRFHPQQAKKTTGVHRPRINQRRRAIDQPRIRP